MTHSDSVLRQLLGIETEAGFERKEISYQRIIDNIHLLDNTTLEKINDIIVSACNKTLIPATINNILLKTSLNQ